MLVIQFLLQVIASSILGLVFSGVCVTGVALHTRYYAIGDNPTARTQTNILLPPPHFADSCPFALPVQLRYSPLAATKLNEPLALIGQYGFVSIAPDQLHRLEPIARRASPRSSTQQLPPPESDHNLCTRIPNRFTELVQALLPGRTTRILLLAFGILVAITATIYFYNRSIVLSLASAIEDARQDPTHTGEELESLQCEADYLARMTRRLTAGLERCTEERDHLYSSATQQNYYKRLASDLEELAMGAVEGLELLDKDNSLWPYLLEHGIILPNYVLTGDQPDSIPDPIPEAPVCSPLPPLPPPR